ncbi:MAG: ComEC/Rec2 family competence protein [bacterium]
MTFSKIFLYFCLSFIAGIFLASFTRFSFPGFLIFAFILISVFWKHKKIVIFGLCVLFFSFGLWRHQSALLDPVSSGEVELVGRIVAEPDKRDSYTNLTVQTAANGRVLLTVSRYPEYQYGQELEIKGELKVPPVFDEFNYQDYLLKEGISSVMYSPEVKLRETKATLGVKAYAAILKFKDKLRESIRENLSPPQSSLLAAIILGDKSRLSTELKNKLNITGLRHITCVSGMHIIILSGILMSSGLALGLWRGQAFYFALAFLFLYILLIGAPPSAIRAGIMAGMLLYAQKIGRRGTSDRALVFAATLMLLVNPFLLKSDIGFQLSFLAVLGIIYFLPFFQNWFYFIPGKSIRDIIAMTFAAQVFTLPILIYNFGYFSLVTPLTNLLVVPLLPSVMIIGFIFVLGGTFLSLPLWLLLTYLVKVIDYFSRLSFASINLEISWPVFLFFYLAWGLLAWRLKKRQRLKFLDY